MTDPTAIVQVNTSVQNAGAPSKLQKTGALITQGGTNTPAQTLTLLTSPADLESILTDPDALSTITWGNTATVSSGVYTPSSGLVVLTLSAATYLVPGSSVTISSATGTGSFASINGTFTCIAGTDATHIAFTVATSLTMTITGGAAAVPGSATATTVSPHGLTIGDLIPVAVTGAVPNGYNVVANAYVTGTSTLVYPVVSNPGSETTPGVITLGEANELLAMVTTFFAQQAAPPVYVLELGEGDNTAGPAALTTFITNNPNVIYSYTVPRNWDNTAPFLTFLTNYTAPSAKTYFFVTTTIPHQAVYAGLKCVFAIVPTPGISLSSEFPAAAVQAITLAYSPGSSNKVSPLSYAFMSGVTPYPLSGNQSVFAGFVANNINWAATGAEGGLSNVILKQGNLQDGNPFNYWFAADYCQINLDLNLANEVINGSNSRINPLYYNQQGINRLQARAVQTLAAAVAAGLGIGQIKSTQLSAEDFITHYNAGDYNGFIVINAEPFLVYSAENPNDYPIGRYGGLACVFTPARGFLQIIFDLTVTNIISV